MTTYTEENIKSLDWRAHTRLRPGMYIGKAGDGQMAEDGIYLLLKEVVDNSIDEFTMGYGKQIRLFWEDKTLEVRDYGRGIPLGKIKDCVSKINTGGKYDNVSFQKSVGLNGVGLKVVNALSSHFEVVSIREGQKRRLCFRAGTMKEDAGLAATDEKNGTAVRFTPDPSIFKDYRFVAHHIDNLLWRYAFLNRGLTLTLNGEKYQSKGGLLDLLSREKQKSTWHYPLIHLRAAQDIEVAFGHEEGAYGEETYSFVNGQYTSQGGTHVQAFKESLAKTLRTFYKKDFHANDLRMGLVSVLSIRMQEPVFESQTKTKLGSQQIAPKGMTLRTFVHQFLSQALDNYLHEHKTVATQLLAQIEQNKKEREEIARVRKSSREKTKKANLHNKKIRDCHVHYNDKRGDKRHQSMLFITEGNSASGSITKCRAPATQAVFSLRGKPLNCFGMSRRLTYENEEFNLLQHALNIEEGMEGLRYNHIILATDADVDGLHIRLLLLTFFIQFFPELVQRGHVYVLETPLFRVRNKAQTLYCYTEGEKETALKKLKRNPEITRFKGLGEISPHEFKHLIGENIQLTPVPALKDEATRALLNFYMGKNTKERQQFIIKNLRTEKEV